MADPFEGVHRCVEQNVELNECPYLITSQCSDTEQQYFYTENVLIHHLYVSVYHTGLRLLPVFLLHKGVSFVLVR